jgi:hypothetical protein
MRLCPPPQGRGRRRTGGTGRSASWAGGDGSQPVGLPFCCGWPEIDSVPADFHSNIDKIGPVGGNVDDATGAGGGSLNIVF